MTDLDSLYLDCLNNQQNPVFRSFLQEREFDQDRVFQLIGYCDQSILDKYSNSEYLLTRDALYSSGFSYLKDRVIFPIHDSYGELLAVCGRATIEVKPKYFNTVYEKKYHLFGLHLSKKEILKHNYVIVVEGYTDWLRLYLHNIPCVALLGIALLDWQYHLLLRYTDRILLCLDNDETGIQSVDKIVAKFKGDGDILLKSLPLHTYKDPDEFIRKKGVVEFSGLYSYFIN